jgi:hypothetical protein
MKIGTKTLARLQVYLAYFIVLIYGVDIFGVARPSEEGDSHYGR